MGAAYHMELPDAKAFENALEFTDKESLPVMINIYAVPHESYIRKEHKDMESYCIDTAKSYCQKAFDDLGRSVPVMGICIDEARYKEDAAYRYDFDKAIFEGVKQLKTACKSNGLNIDDKFVLGGYSDGGVASLAFAAKHPEELAGLITGGAADAIQVADDTIAPPLGIKGMGESQVKALAGMVQLHMIGEHEYYSEMHDHCKMRFNKPVYGTKEDTMRYAIKYKDEYEFNSDELDPIKRINRIEAHNRAEGFNIKTEIVENGWHQPEEARDAPEALTREIVNMDDRYMHSFRRFYEGMLLKEPEPGIVIEDIQEDNLDDQELDIKNGG